MRLLQCSESGELSVQEFDDSVLPAYAILSHTWGADKDEVTFADIDSGHGSHKLGYKKILFCAKQTRRDNLSYFWIDTCCIDKKNKAELAFSIRSMFRWYRGATRCYVYLSDVSVQSSAISKSHDETRWFIYLWMLSLLYSLLGRFSVLQYFSYSRRVLDPPVDCGQDQQIPKFSLRQSRWFFRGWTLQELLAPPIVEFFSKEGTRLGDKVSLAEEVCEITRIPISALQGKHLSDFGVLERISWSDSRETKLPEDSAYSLMGILGVSLSPIYGEGKSGAMKRVLREIEKLHKHLQDLRPSDPRDDKKCIEDTKGGLLAESYRWVFDNTSYRQWRQDQHNQLLWVKGDPGKGKTMLLCGIIDELQGAVPQTALLLSYFFCQATDSRVNSATAVLRGLLYMLVGQQPLLVSHIRKKYDLAGKTLFEDINAWFALAEIFTDVLRDENLNTATYIVIDALDECVIDQPKLLSFIATQSSVSPRVKWIVSSRNWPVIEEQLVHAEHRTKLSLELNAESVAAAVKIFIRQRVSQLAQERGYTADVQDVVLQYLESNANDTFLWVALVCQDLKNTPKWEMFETSRALEKLAMFPPGLDSLYKRMMQLIQEARSAELCLRILAVTAVLYRPVTVSELTALVKHLEDFTSALEMVREMIGLCGSFLTMRDDTVYFVHQSAKDFLFSKASKEVFPDGVEDIHQAIFSASLARLSRTLHKDMYNLHAPDCAIENVRLPEVDPLATSRYSCVYWIDHVYDSKPMLSVEVAGDQRDGEQWTEAIKEFLQEKFLYWLEGLSLCKSIEKGVVSLAKLQSLVQILVGRETLAQIVQDAYRFVTYHKQAIETYPLQIYASALLFSPKNSLVRKLFQHEAPENISIKPQLNENWNACIQTLEGHGREIKLVAASHDSTMLVSASDENYKMWDTSSGACIQTLRGHGQGHKVKFVAFSPDDKRLATATDKMAKIWDTSNGTCLKTLENFATNSVAFSHDLTRLTLAFGNVIEIWDVSSGTCVQMLRGHDITVDLLVYSSDSAKLASVADQVVKIWDARSGACLHTIDSKATGGSVWSVTFSPDSTKLVSAVNQTFQIWSINSSNSSDSSACLQKIKGHGDAVVSVAFSHDLTTRLASASDDGTVKIWDIDSGTCLQTLTGHADFVNSMAFYHNSTRLASVSDDKTIKIWNISGDKYSEAFENHTDLIRLLAFSHDSTMLASVSGERNMKIWGSDTGMCLHTLKGHGYRISSVAFSHNSTTLVSASGDNTIRIWNTSSGACLQTLRDHQKWVTSAVFSHDSTRLASASEDKTIKIWDIGNESRARCLHTLRGHDSFIPSVAFSHDSRRLASASHDGTVKLWDVSDNKGVCLQTIECHAGWTRRVAFSRNSTKLASLSNDGTVKIWDVSSDSSSTCLKTIQSSTKKLNSADLIAILASLYIHKDRIALRPSVPRGPAVSPDGTWIANDGQNLLWIPTEYRAIRPVVSGRYVGMGTGVGKVWICRLLGDSQSSSSMF